MDSAYKCPHGWDLTQLLAYVEGQLEPTLRSQLEQHVKVCPFCAEELTSLQRMSTLLKNHPESFHLDEEALYRFVSQGLDPTGEIATHIASCETCKHDAALLRDMITRRETPYDIPAMPQSLLARVARPELPSSSSVQHRLAAAWEDLRKRLFRMPALALASAAAIVLIVAVCLPLWRSFGLLGSADYASIRTESIVPQSADSNRLRGQSVGTEGLPTMHTQAGDNRVGPKQEQEKPARHPVGTWERSPTPRVYGEKQKSESSEEHVPCFLPQVTDVQKPAPSVSVIEPAPAREMDRHPPDTLPPHQASVPAQQMKTQLAPSPSETDKPSFSTAPPVSRARPRAALQGIKKNEAKEKPVPDQPALPTSVPVKVHITDGQGNRVSWIEARLPSELKHRFRLIASGSSDPEARETEKSFRNGSVERAKGGQSEGLRIDIRIHESEDTYDVVCKLLEVSSGREIASVVAVRQNRNEIAGVVQSALQRLLEHQ